MNKKEAGDFFKKNIIPPFMVIALFLALSKMESCNNSLNEQANNQVTEPVKGDLKKGGLLNTISDEVKNFLGRRDQAGNFGKK